MKKIFLTVVHLLLFCMVLPCASLSALGQAVEIPLSTKANIFPVYFTLDLGPETSVSAEYIKQLTDTLDFDLNMSGYTEVLSKTRERENLRYIKDTSDPEKRAKFFRTASALYYLHIVEEGGKLKTSLFSAAPYQEEVLAPLELSMDLQQDRKQMHQIVDTAVERWFHKKGIASTRILYTVRKPHPRPTKGKEYISEIWQCDYDGQNNKQVTGGGDYKIMPVFMPPKPGFASGSYFFVSYKTGQPKIYMASMKDREGRRFSHLRGNQLMPAIASTRKTVAFISDVTGSADLFIQDFDPMIGSIGKPRQIFSTYRGTQASPTFSPDGRFLAFVSNKDGTPRVYVMQVPKKHENPKNFKPRLVSIENKENTSPSWSSDGNKLVYSSLTKGVRQIWIADLVQGTEEQLTFGENHKENPSFASNGQHIVYNTASPNSHELYIMNIYQKKPVQISSGLGEKRFPHWEPRM